MPSTTLVTSRRMGFRAHWSWKFMTHVGQKMSRNVPSQPHQTQGLWICRRTAQGCHWRTHRNCNFRWPCERSASWRDTSAETRARLWTTRAISSWAARPGCIPWNHGMERIENRNPSPKRNLEGQRVISRWGPYQILGARASILNKIFLIRMFFFFVKKLLVPQQLLGFNARGSWYVFVYVFLVQKISVRGHMS